MEDVGYSNPSVVDLGCWNVEFYEESAPDGQSRERGERMPGTTGMFSVQYIMK